MPEVTIAIWSKSFFNSKKIGQFVGNGHAGLQLRINAAVERYISWHAVGNEAHMYLGFEKIKDKKTGTVYDNRYAWNADPRATDKNYKPIKLGQKSTMGALEFSEDIDLYGPPSFQKTIKAQELIAGKLNDCMWGLNTDAIERWWLDILKLPVGHPRRKHATFSLSRDTETSQARNCCGTVVEALTVGGLERFASGPSNILYQGASSLLRWVEKASAKIDSLNRQRIAIIDSPDFDSSGTLDGQIAKDLDNVPDLPSVEQWMESSRVNASLRTGIARRKEQIAEIDRLLPRYHACRRQINQNDALPYPLADPRQEWLVLLGQMQEQCFSHLVEKRNSDRRQAVLAFAKSLIRVLTGYSRHQANLRRAIAGEIENVTTSMRSGSYRSGEYMHEYEMTGAIRRR